MSQYAARIISEAELRLEAALYGLVDMRGPPRRRICDYHNAVVFGRMITFVLQNMKGKVPGFEEWYQEKQGQMREDKLLRFFHEERTAIEKQATSRISNFMTFTGNSSDILRALNQSKPPGAISAFVGDHLGGSGWIITLPNGESEKYYVDMKVPGLEVGLTLACNLQELMLGEENLDRILVPADQAVEQFLGKMKALIEEARERFVQSSLT